MTEQYRLIAIDLPGHGASGDAFDPNRTYSMVGYAEATIAVLEALDIRHFAVFGWSLGGHVALELMPRHRGVLGVMIAGAPPVRQDAESIQKGFKPTPALYLAGKEHFTDEDFDAFYALTCGDIVDDELLAALHRTHGLARRLSFESLLAGRASDQRNIAETSRIPIAVVNGENDPIVDLDYIGQLHYRNLWDKHCFVLRNLHHVPFYEDPSIFNPILGRFLADVHRRYRLGAISGGRQDAA